MHTFPTSKLAPSPTSLITKVVFDQWSELVLSIKIKSEHHLELQQILRLPPSIDHPVDLFPEAIPHLSQRFDLMQGHSWSDRVSASRQPKFIIGGAKIQECDRTRRQSFFLLCVYQNPYAYPHRPGDGNFGIRLLPTLDLSSPVPSPFDPKWWHSMLNKGDVADNFVS